ncbi:Uncharacterized protein TCM_019054 [Theobroma cacao]|uniref:Retroviral polymerase SH3-like domain-containing protein n=1 Tax=Theobroma cacao TaxID=3641 RepID=A0A061EG25_THECC|nr:Uncharacterized protein TCM_019054 [Theobroma cacao]
MSDERIKRLVNDKVLNTLDFTDFDAYVDYIKGKQTNKTKKGAKRSSDILEIIHTNICSLDMDSYKLDPKTISGYYVGYAERSKRYKCYYLSHNIRIVESRNAKFLENDLIRRNDQSQNLIFEKNHCDIQTPISSDRLIVIHNTHQIQMEIIEQLVVQHIPQEDVNTTLRRFTRMKKSAIPSDYIVYIQEADNNVGVENDFETFSQAMKLHQINVNTTFLNGDLDEEDCSPSVAPIGKGDRFNLNQCLKNELEREQMQSIPYASVVGSLMRTNNLEVVSYSDSNFVGCVNSQKSTSRYGFIFAGKAMSWRSAKQTLTATSTMEVEFVSCFEATSHVARVRGSRYDYWTTTMGYKNLAEFGDQGHILDEFTKNTRKHVKRRKRFLDEVFCKGS